MKLHTQISGESFLHVCYQMIDFYDAATTREFRAREIVKFINNCGFERGLVENELLTHV